MRNLKKLFQRFDLDSKRQEQLDAQYHVTRLLEYIGEDPHREGLKDTPMRVLKAWKEMTSGYQINPEEILQKNFNLHDVEGEFSRYDEIILSKDIPFSSNCEHHLLPFFGVAHVAYIPNAKTGRIVGLSKLGRLVDCFAKRLQVEERLTQQIAETIKRVVDPVGVAVIIEAKHSCQCFRGIKKEGSMVTSCMMGAFRSNPLTRQELLQLIALNTK